MLDTLSAEQIDIYNKAQEKLQEYYYDEYYYYASERAKRSSQIGEALNKKTCKIEFNNHYRCVTSQFNDRPLSAKGSKVSSIGGRFNFGSGNAAIPSFASLYVGENLVTARCEILQKDANDQNKITLEDFIGTSMSDYRVHGNLNNVLDITEKNNLKPFLKIIQRIETSQDLHDKAIRAGLSDNITSVRKMSELEEVLLNPNWRLSIVRFGIPSNSQSFGNLIKLAGVEAIKYRSKYSNGYCLAIFPENLTQGSFVALTDKAAAGVIPRLDGSSFNQFL